jgi:site-specific recombinase XerC
MTRYQAASSALPFHQRLEELGCDPRRGLGQAPLLGCGLRRRELADLEFAHLQRRDEHWAIVDLVGKGGHIRTVPVPDWVKVAIDRWVGAADLSAGRLFRCVCRAGKRWGDGVTERVVWHVVKDYGRRLGLS